MSNRIDVERELRAYEGNWRRDAFAMLVVCVAGVVVIGSWVLLAKPADGWLSVPVIYVGAPSAIGVLVTSVLLLVRRRHRLLDDLRDGVAVRGVKRTVKVVERYKGNPSRYDRRIPTVTVDLENGRTYTLVWRIGEGDRLDRICALLQKQIEEQPTAHVASQREQRRELPRAVLLK